MTTASPANQHPAHIDHAALRFYLPADQLKRLRDLHHGPTPGAACRAQLSPIAAAHRRHDGALCAAGDVRLVTGLGDALNDVLDLLVRGIF